MMFVLQGIFFENSCNGFSFVWPRRQHKLENNDMYTNKIKVELNKLQELLPQAECSLSADAPSVRAVTGT